MRLVVLAVLAVVASGCIRDNLVRCGGALCPTGAMCVAEICASPDQLAACAALESDASCVLPTGAVGRCQSGVCSPTGCGNRVVDPGEVCDDGDIMSGDGCSGTCDSEETCGNGVLDVVTGESCDCGASDAVKPATCINTNSDDLSSACTTACQLRRCGDGVVAGPEQCDGPLDTTDDTGISCDMFGYYAGTLSCSPLCQYDVSACSERCGDGMVQATFESCDGKPPSDQSCLEFGYDLGALGCNSLCAPNLRSCDHLGWSRAHPAVKSATDVQVRDDRTLVLFLDATVAFRVGTTDLDPSGTYQAIALTPTRAYAIGAVPMMHYGASWTALPAKPWSGTVKAAWATDTLGLFVAVAGATSVYHWTGTAWTSYTIAGGAMTQPRLGGSSTRPFLFDVTPPRLLIWDGTSFVEDTTLPNTPELRAAAQGGNDIYIATSGDVHRRPAAGGSWVVQPIVATGAFRIVANGLGGVDILGTNTTIERVGPGALRFAAPPGTSAITVDGGRSYVAGPSSGVFGLRKGVWQAQSLPASTPALYACLHGDLNKNEEILLAGPTSGELRANRWTVFSNLPQDTRDVFTAGRDVVATAPSAFFYIAGSGPLQFFDSSTIDPMRLWFDGTEAFAVGEGGVLRFKVDTVNVQEIALPYSLLAISGRGRDDLFAAGSDASGEGAILHWDGSSWLKVDTGLVLDKLNDIYVAPNGRVFAVGGTSLYMGEIGSQWKTFTVPGSHLVGVSGTSDSDIFVVGDASFGFSFSGLAHFDGSELYPVRLPDAGRAHEIHVTPGAIYLLLTDVATSTDSFWVLARTTTW